jgi:hypothetical protein
MVPLYAARIEDLGPSDFVKVECIACSYGKLIPPSLRVHGNAPVTRLEGAVGGQIEAPAGSSPSIQLQAKLYRTKPRHIR